MILDKNLSTYVSSVTCLEAVQPIIDHKTIILASTYMLYYLYIISLILDFYKRNLTRSSHYIKTLY